jgi:hypothetical protein
MQRIVEWDIDEDYDDDIFASKPVSSYCLKKERDQKQHDFGCVETTKKVIPHTSNFSPTNMTQINVPQVVTHKKSKLEALSRFNDHWGRPLFPEYSGPCTSKPKSNAMKSNVGKQLKKPKLMLPTTRPYYPVETFYFGSSQDSRETKCNNMLDDVNCEQSSNTPFVQTNPDVSKATPWITPPRKTGCKHLSQSSTSTQNEDKLNYSLGQSIDSSSLSPTDSDFPLESQEEFAICHQQPIVHFASDQQIINQDESPVMQFSTQQDESIPQPQQRFYFQDDNHLRCDQNLTSTEHHSQEEVFIVPETVPETEHFHISPWPQRSR